MKQILLIIITVGYLLFSCNEPPIIRTPLDPTPPQDTIITCLNTPVVNNQDVGCDGQKYPTPDESNYILPFPPGQSYPTGLTNCSSSFHASGKGDQYAFDFNMPEGEPFHAIRAGIVVKKVDDTASDGSDGSAGNYLVIDHGDNTYGLYYHSPKNGIYVNKGDQIKQGQLLGLVGASGYAGYPHLHLIVVKEKHEWPYEGIPISFKNANPRHTVLVTNFAGYEACDY